MGCCFGRMRSSSTTSIDTGSYNSGIEMQSYCRFDKEIQMFAEFVDKFTEEVQQQLEFSNNTEIGLQELLNSINSRLVGKSEDSEIESLKGLLRSVHSKATNYRKACVRAADKGSQTRIIELIKHEIRNGRFHLLFDFVQDMLEKVNYCSQCLDLLESDCRSTTKRIRSTRDAYETSKQKASSGQKDSTIATSTGAGITAAGALLSIIFPVVGIPVALAGLATTVGGAIGLAVYTDRLKEINKALNSVSFLSSDLESVKRRVSAVSTIMDECEENINGVNQSSRRAAKIGYVSFATQRKIELSLDNMCSQFVDLQKKQL